MTSDTKVIMVQLQPSLIHSIVLTSRVPLPIDFYWYTFTCQRCIFSQSTDQGSPVSSVTATASRPQ